MSSLSLLRSSYGRQLTRDPFDDLPLGMHLDFIEGRRQRILEFILSLVWCGLPLLRLLKGAYVLLLEAA